MKKFNSKQEETVLDVIEPTESQVNELQTELDLARVELSKVTLELEEKRKQVKETARREISEDELKIIDKQITRGHENKSKKEIVDREKEYDNVQVTGRFINRRTPGQTVKLTYQKHEGDPVKWWVMEDGKVYTIPRGFADQINEYYHTPRFIQNKEEMDPNRPASVIHEVDTSNKKYAFTPINF